MHPTPLRTNCTNVIHALDRLEIPQRPAAYPAHVIEMTGTTRSNVISVSCAFVNKERNNVTRRMNNRVGFKRLIGFQGYLPKFGKVSKETTTCIINISTATNR